MSEAQPPSSTQPRRLSIGELLRTLKEIPEPPATPPEGLDQRVSDEVAQYREAAPREAKEDVVSYSQQLNWREELERDSLKQDINERKSYANKIFKMICFWLFGVFFLLLSCGSHYFGNARFDLPDSVILAVLGGTTVNVLGLFIIVANYLFPNRKKE